MKDNKKRPENSQQTNVEPELEKAEGLLESLVKEAPLSIWVCDEEGQIILWNKAAEAIYGHNSEQALGSIFWDLFVKDDEIEQAKKDLNETFTKRAVQKNYYVVDEDKHGNILHMLVNTFLIESENGKTFQAEVGSEVSGFLERLMATQKELEAQLLEQRVLQERIRLLEKLRETTKRVSQSLQTESAGLDEVLLEIVESTLELIQTSKNKTSAALVLFDGENSKWSTAVGVGELHNALTDLPSNEDSIVIRILRSGDPVYSDVERPHPSSKSLPTWTSEVKSFGILPLKWEQTPQGVIVLACSDEFLFSDEIKNTLELFSEQVVVAVNNARLIEELRTTVSEKNASYERLAELSRQIADKEAALTRATIARDFAHGMNNLLGHVPIQAQLIRRSLNKNAPDVLDRVGKYLDSIEGQMSDVFRKVEALHERQESESVNVEKLLISMIDNIRTQYSDKVKVEADLKPTKPVDAVQINLANAIWNVLSNSLDAMKEGGKLTITTDTIQENNQDYIEIVCADTGVGIPAEKVSEVFDPKYTTKGPTHGYGLTRTKDIVEGIGGKIDVQSTEGKGTTCKILLPAAPG